MTRGLRYATAAVALAVVLAGGAAYGWKAYQRGQECQRIEAGISERGSQPVGDGPMRAVVLGDSYAQGWMLDDPRDSWPRAMAEELHATVEVDAVAGSGFTGSTYCDDTAYGDRAPSLPDAGLVVVQGGLNDVDADPAVVTSDAVSVLRASDADVLVGPPPAPQRDRADVAAVDAALADAAHDAGVQYVSTLGWGDLDYLDDGLHLTPASHEVFGQRVAAAVRSADRAP